MLTKEIIIQIGVAMLSEHHMLAQLGVLKMCQIYNATHSNQHLSGREVFSEVLQRHEDAFVELELAVQNQQVLRATTQ